MALPEWYGVGEGSIMSMVQFPLGADIVGHL